MKTLKTLSLAVICIFTMSFSCYHYGDNPTPNSCDQKSEKFKKKLERNSWNAFYSDPNGQRIDAEGISSSTLYNPTIFYSGRIEEKNYLGAVIDTGVFVIQNCGKILRVKTNLSRSTQITENNPDGWLDFNVIYESKDSIVTEVSITGVPFIKYFTLVK